MQDDQLQDFLALLGGAFNKLREIEPDPTKASPEICQVSLKLSEAGMWMRMHYDMQKAPNVEIKQGEKRVRIDGKDIKP